MVVQDFENEARAEKVWSGISACLSLVGREEGRPSAVDWNCRHETTTLSTKGGRGGVLRTGYGKRDRSVDQTLTWRRSDYETLRHRLGRSNGLHSIGIGLLGYGHEG